MHQIKTLRSFVSVAGALSFLVSVARVLRSAVAGALRSDVCGDQGSEVCYI